MRIIDKRNNSNSWELGDVVSNGTDYYVAGG